MIGKPGEHPLFRWSNNYAIIVKWIINSAHDERKLGVYRRRMREMGIPREFVHFLMDDEGWRGLVGGGCREEMVKR